MSAFDIIRQVKEQVTAPQSISVKTLNPGSANIISFKRNIVNKINPES